VAVTVGDPVALGLVASRARPSGNVTGMAVRAGNLTGVTLLDPSSVSRRLALLREAMPRLARVAVLWHPPTAGMAEELAATLLAARTQGLELQVREVRAAADIATAFASAERDGVGAILPLQAPFLYEQRAQIIALAAEKRLPCIYDLADYVEDGGLMAYGTSIADGHRHAATYVDKILQGRTTADLPVASPLRFKLVLNERAARAIGFTFPPSLLAQAETVVSSVSRRPA
jgi:putative tryptophan/tyrosine transport system substrate-binding protein